MKKQKEPIVLVEIALSRALGRKDLTTKEAKTLLEKKYPEYSNEITTIINKYIKNGFLNDDKYIKDYIDLGLRKYHGLNRIRYELKMKGFHESRINEYINDESKEIESISARKLAEKCLNAKAKDMTNKVINKLNYAGYPKGLIMKILNELDLESDND